MFGKQRRRVRKWLAGPSRRRKQASRHRKVKIISFLVGLLFFLVLGAMIAGFATIAYFSKDLPSPDKLSTREVAQSTKIYSRDGVLLYEIFGDKRRTMVKLEDIPKHLKQATIAVEDAEFYSHSGFDLLGIMRAAWVTLTGQGLQGGSTITQQVVKNTLLSPERTITRKIKEFILAVELERRYSKNQILRMYFNEVPYGGQAWGVGAAAEMYFGKHVRDLTLAESSLIAGLPQAPSLYSPCGAYPENSKQRQETVLNLMVKNGFITQQEKQQVLKEEPKVVCMGYSKDDLRAPHFSMYVKSKLTEMFGEKVVEQGGLRVKTTLDWGKQQTAQEEVDKQLKYLKEVNANATNAGVVSVDPKTGEILAMVGSADYFDKKRDGNVNVILQPRQPGSSIKPVTYLAAFKRGYSPATYMSDIRTCFPGGAGQPDYCPINWDDKYWGPMSMRKALANSRNIPAVKTLQLVGIDNMLSMAHDLGISTLNQRERYGLSLTLGAGEVKPIDMARVFSTFAAMGKRPELTPILKVTDYQGKVLHEFRPSAQKIVEPGYVYLLNNVLSDARARRPTFGDSLEIGRPLAVKTGTTNENRDAWTIGYTPQLVTVVWVGNFNNEKMNGIYGSTGATPIMRGFMKRSLEGTAVKDWEKPDSVITKTVDQLSGLIPQKDQDFSVKKEVFVKGTEPTQVDDFHVPVKVCKNNKNRLATKYHIENNLAVERVFIYLKEVNESWQKYTNKWMAKRKEEGYGKPPEKKCKIVVDGEEVEGPYVKIKQPKAETEFKGKETFKVEAEIYSPERITKVEFRWDEKLVAANSGAPFTAKFNLSEFEQRYLQAGPHMLRVIATDSAGEQTIRSITVLIEGELTPTPSPSPTPGS